MGENEGFYLTIYTAKSVLLSASLESTTIESSKGLFTWREGAHANRATRLEGLTQIARLYMQLT